MMTQKLTRHAFSMVLLAGILLLTATPLLAGFSQNGDNPHGPIDLACNDCHGTEGWDRLLPVMQFNHDADTRYPLEGQHGQVACAACHTSLVFRDADTDCFSCHTDIHEGQFGNSCDQCHAPQNWQDEPRFRQMHQETRFPLVGVHAGLDCQACHSSGQYRDLSTECITCHLDTYQATTDPDHSAAGFSTDCNECHGVARSGGGAGGDWGGPDVQFVHTQAFPLTGGHNVNDCALCHVAGQAYTDVSNECDACHHDDFVGTTDPDHSGAAFNTMCQLCHTTLDWAPAEFANHDLTNFPLDGAHTNLDCALCHEAQYTGTPDQCVDCHREDYEGVNDPDHVEGQFDFDCTMCHTTLAYTPAEFDHSGTNFIIDGAHVELVCMDCHADGFNNTAYDCYSCHEEDYVGVEEPRHNPDSFDLDCTLCHTTAEWTPSNFNHDAQTDYALTGEHINTECNLCHVDGVYSGTPDDCWSCHEEEYRSTEDPDHETQNYPFDCTLCHTTITWEGAEFDHDLTNFPLTGEHRNVDCALCHIDGVYAGTPTDCYACHQAEYEGTDDPDHVAEGFPTDCTLCHNTSDWDDSTFDHDQTNFPLTGAHRSLDCTLCHSDGYVGTPTDCWSCHQADYEGTDDPDHAALNYPHDCTECHTTDDWDADDFDHASYTEWPLTGAHVSLDCTLCHTTGFSGTPDDCWSCHEDDYSGVADPNHSSAGFGQVCTECHTTADWSAPLFDHADTGWPLTGSHNGLDCNLCHSQGYTNTPSDCFFCHEADYNSANDPNHVSAGFPQTCESCHNTVNWDDANFNHDAQWFPIYSGEHRNEWDSCSECHPNPDNYLVFTCISCHEHRQSEMDDEHDDVGGYVYASSACYDCHPDGRAEDDRLMKQIRTNSPKER